MEVISPGFAATSGGKPSRLVAWRDLAVGELVRVPGDTEFPADLVLVGRCIVNKLYRR